MSIAYVGQSHAKSGQSDKLREFMRSVVLPAVRSSAGCESCLMLQSEDDPTRFIGIEVWTSIEAHRAEGAAGFRSPPSVCPTTSSTRGDSVSVTGMRRTFRSPSVYGAILPLRGISRLEATRCAKCRSGWSSRSKLSILTGSSTGPYSFSGPANTWAAAA